jgi:hypothetical protein
MYSKLLLIILATGLVAVLMSVVLAMRFRKDIPSQEVLRLKEAIAVINGKQSYLKNQLQVALYYPNGEKRLSDYDSRGVCLFSNLTQQGTYQLEIRRKDLKGMLLYRPLKIAVNFDGGTDQYWVLVGASVGQAWDFPKIPQMLHWQPGLVLGFRAIYQFDKTPEIGSLVSIAPWVTGVIIKECAAYFPDDPAQSRQLVERWVNQLRQHKIQAALATVVPITEEADRLRPNRFQAIVTYNDFIRSYSAQNNIPLLDLEKSVRVSESNRHLRPEFAQADGVHLLPIAYRNALTPLVGSLTWMKK